MPRDDADDAGDSTVKLRLSTLDVAAMRALGAELPTSPPITATRATPDRDRHDTPHAVVLPSVSAADRATLTVLQGPDVGATFKLARETILGRSREATIPLDEPSLSRRHARIVLTERGRYLLEDLGSKNGTYLGGRRVVRATLRSGDRVQLGGACLLRFAFVDETEETFQRRMYVTATHDELTGLVNRGTLERWLGAEIGRTHREGGDVAFLLIDLDHFKRVNDTFGHLAGDQVLRATALAGEQALRERDVLARYGGEEFAVLAHDTSKSEAVALAERLRNRLSEVSVEAGAGAVHITVSIGVALLAECEPASDPVHALIELADARLYAAKANGRNRICAVTSPTDP